MLISPRILTWRLVTPQSSYKGKVLEAGSFVQQCGTGNWYRPPGNHLMMKGFSSQTFPVLSINEILISEINLFERIHSTEHSIYEFLTIPS